MEILEIIGIPYYQKGSEIHIKKKNHGKFTRSAKEHNMGVLEFATHILNNKNEYSPTLVKRANFAKNSKKFKHAKGGQLVPKNKSGNPIKKQESVRDNTNVAQKPLNWALKEMINNPQDYDSYEKLISYKGRAKHEDPKKITPRKNTRPVPRSITNGRHKNNA